MSRIFIALFSVVLLVPIILIVANRAEPDQRGQRSHSVYLFGMSFVTLQLTFAGSVLIVTSIFSVIAPHFAPLTNSIARSVVIGGLLVVLFGAVLLLHLGRGIETARGDGGVTGPNLRVMQSYAGVVSFIYLLQLIFSLAVAIYLVFALVAPGVFGSLGSNRSGTLAMLLDLVYVMLASGYILDGPLVARPDGHPDPPAADRGPRRQASPVGTRRHRPDHRSTLHGAALGPVVARGVVLHGPVVPERHRVLGPGEAALVLGGVGLAAEPVEQLAGWRRGPALQCG